ncbi:MAG: MoaD/ThiS family protein [Thermodesulfobacteriota bacterium]
MKIRIEFIGFPVIYDLFPEGAHPYALAGETVAQLIDDLISRNGSRVQEVLLDPGTKELDPTIQIRINTKFISRDEIPQQKIEDGDHITFFRLLAGG